MIFGETSRLLPFMVGSHKHTHAAVLGVVDPYQLGDLDPELLNLEMLCLKPELVLNSKPLVMPGENLFDKFGEIHFPIEFRTKPFDLSKFKVDKEFFDIWYLGTKYLSAQLCNEYGPTLPELHTEMTPATEYMKKYLLHPPADLIGIINLRCAHLEFPPYLIGGLDPYTLGQLDPYPIGVFNQETASRMLLQTSTSTITKLTYIGINGTGMTLSTVGEGRISNDIMPKIAPMELNMMGMRNMRYATLDDLDGRTLEVVDARKLTMKVYGGAVAVVTTETDE